EQIQVAKGTDTGGSPRRHETIGGTLAQTRSERVLEQPSELPLPEGHTSRSREGSMEHIFELTDNVPPTPHDSPLTGGHTPGSDEGRLKLEDLMDICTNLSNRVLTLEEAKTTQDRVLRVRRLEKKRKARTPQPIKRRLFKGRVETFTDTSLGEDASKQGRSNDKTKPMFKDSDFDVLDAEQITTTGPSHVSTANQVSTTKPEVSAATPSTPPTTATIFDDEDVTMAMDQTLIKMKEVKAKEKVVEFRNIEEASRPIRSTTTLQPLPKIDLKDKGKSVLVEEDPKKVKSRDQGLADIKSDTELAQRLHEEELTELDRAQIERQRQEEATNAALTEELQFLVEIIAAQRKFRAAQRAVEIRSKPPTKTQLRNLMMTYLKNTGGYKHSQLKGKTYEEIHELYERQQKRNQDFKPMDSEKEVQESEEEAAEYEKEKEELRLSLKIISGDDSEVNYEPLSRRFPILYESCGVHTLFMDGTPMEINMLVEKKYPLIKELLEKMLNLLLEAEEEIQEKLPKEEIENMVEGEEDEESYASEFADSMFNDDDDDSDTRIEPLSHKENLKVVDEDEVNDKVKKDEKKNDDAEKMDVAAKEKDNDDHIDHTLVGSGSMETRNDQMQTPIPTPTRSPRKDLSSDKTISEELTATVSPTTATTSKNKSKRGFTCNKTKILLGIIADMYKRRVLDHCKNVVPEMTFAKTNEMIKEEMPRLVNLAVNKDREIAPTNVPELISEEFATHGPKMIEELYPSSQS
ncbi:hypothetical protein Tco_0444508, partial [Tanacetum coccineum]